MRRLVADIEADDLLDAATVIHCIVAKDIDTGEKFHFYGNETVPGHHGSIACGIDFLFSAHLLVGHNFIEYDLPVIYKLYGRAYTGQVLDTLVMSRTLNPERKLAKGTPTSVKNPITGKKDKIGPHSLAAWGYRVGRGKPEHYDWKQFSEAMLHRCDEDVEINHLTLNYLLAEAGAQPGSSYNELPDYVRVEQQVSQIMFRQHQVGWLVDRELLRKHINTLHTMIAKLEVELDPRLPFIATTKDISAKARGEGKTCDGVKKPFLKSGEWSKSVKAHWPEFKQVWDLGKRKADTDHVMSVDNDSIRYKFSIAGPFCRVSFRKISLTSDAEVKDFLLRQGWQPDEWNYSKITKKVTSPKFTESSLDTIKGDTGKLIAQHMKAKQRLGTMEGWLAHLGPDNRLHGIVNPQACPTVRMTHKILVNVPSVEKKSFFAEEMREVFIAKPGYVLVGCDVKSCQARMLAYYMGDDDFTYAVIHGKKEDGTDIHTLNMNKAGLPTRGHAKNFFYGFIFGAGPAKVGRLINGDKNAGKRIIDRYLSGMPKLNNLRKGLEKTWKERGGWLTGLDGRKIYIATKKDLLVYMLQSAEAMIIKIAICLVNHWARQEGLDFEQVCVMHDEYSFEVLDKDKERMKFLAEHAIWEAGKMLGLPEGFAEGEAADGLNWKDIH